MINKVTTLTEAVKLVREGDTLALGGMTLYRRPVAFVRELIRQVCREAEVEILRGHVSKDHVHLLVSIPPQVAISRFVQRLKGKTSFKMLNEFPHLRKTYWGRHLWARGYFCCSSGNVTDDVIKEYIANQAHEADEDFRVEGDEDPNTGPKKPST